MIGKYARGLKKFAQRAAYWTLPAGIQSTLRAYIHRHPLDKQSLGHILTREEKSLLQRNRILHNCHQGKRCFILATGPSVKNQNLRLLQNEICIAVSNFYIHANFALIKPRYYCIAPYHLPLTEEAWHCWMQKLDAATHDTDTVMFFALSDCQRNQRNGLFAGRKIHYLHFNGSYPWDLLLTKGLDIAWGLPGPQSVAIMALLVALYMGFSQIYLIGCDHDTLFRWNGSSCHSPKHFYDGAPTVGYEPFDIEVNLKAFLRLRQQYRYINQIAQRNKIRIMNTSPTSFIDIFPKLSLETVCKNA